jgi:hypothetical protein
MKCYLLSLLLRFRAHSEIKFEEDPRCPRCKKNLGEYERFTGGDFSVSSMEALDLDLASDFRSSYVIASQRAMELILRWHSDYDIVPCTLSYTYRKKITVREGFFLLQMRKSQTFLVQGKGLPVRLDCVECGASRWLISNLSKLEKDQYPDGLFSLNSNHSPLINERCLQELIEAFPTSFDEDSLKEYL